MKRTPIKNKIIIIFTTTLLTLWGFSEAQDLDDLVPEYFLEVRSGNYPPMPKEISDPQNAVNILYLLSPYMNDSASATRAKAYEILQQCTSRSSVAVVRIHGVNKLIEACRDKDVGNIGLVLYYLTGYAKDDFTLLAKDSLKSLFRFQTPHFDMLLKLAGFLELTYLKDEIRLYTQPGNSSQIRWAAILCLARMGEESMIKDMMKRVTKLPVNDNTVYEIFPDLVYTRQPEALNYLVKILTSDEKNCMRADAERESPIVCGYRIMEQIAPIIDGFPLILDEHGDIDTIDYAGALVIVREWFKAHPTFKILNDKY